MNWLYDTVYDVFEFLNPWTRSRGIYLHGKRGWRQLLVGVSPEAKVLLMTGFFWTLPLALTEPFKSLYLTKLGLDAFDLGGVNGLDMGLRSVGVLLGGWLGLRYGHKRTLLWGDFISWVVSTAILSLATRPAHIILWACLMATNSVVSASFQQIFLRATPKQSHTGAYGFMNLSIVLPGLFMPFIASLLLGHFDFVMTMRVMLGIQALCMAFGNYQRWRNIKDEPGEVLEGQEPLSDRLAAVVKSIVDAPGSFHILAFWILSNIAGNYWRVYFSLFVVQKMGWHEANLGYYSQIVAVAFVFSSLFWLPRIKGDKIPRNLFWVNLLNQIPPLLLFAGPGLLPMLGINLIGGLGAALNAALTAAVMISILPENNLALAFSLCVALMQLLLGASFPAVGALFRDNMFAFAWTIVIMNVLQLALVFSLWRRSLRPQFIS